MKSKITIRISDSLRDKLSELSEMEEISVSEVARTILESHFSSNKPIEKKIVFSESEDFLKDKSFEECTPNDSINQEYNDSIFSEEFFKLVIWIYDQKESRTLKLSKYEFESFKDYIIKIQLSNEIPKQLKNEFDKVYVDLIKLINKEFPTYLRPNFANGNSSGFNYIMLNEFLFPERIIINLSDI